MAVEALKSTERLYDLRLLRDRSWGGVPWLESGDFTSRKQRDDEALLRWEWVAWGKSGGCV